MNRYGYTDGQFYQLPLRQVLIHELRDLPDQNEVHRHAEPERQVNHFDTKAIKRLINRLLETTGNESPRRRDGVW